MKKSIILLCSLVMHSWAGPTPLTLEQALALARTHSPELRAAQAEIDASQQQIRTAGYWRNPDLAFETEGLGGNNNGFDRAEYKAGILQEFPISGKIGKARIVARHGKQVASLGLDVVKLNIEITVRIAFIEVLAQKQIKTIRMEQEDLAVDFFKITQKRYEEGGASELDFLQSEMLLEEALLEKSVAEKQFEYKREELALLIGIPFSELGLLKGDLFRWKENPSVQVNHSHPALKQLQAREDQTHAEAQLAKTQGIPDISLGAGIKYEAESNIQSFEFMAVMPLPFFNNGRSQEATANLQAEAINAQQEAAFRTLQNELFQWKIVLETASVEAHRYEEILLPKAEKIYELSRVGYEAGRYSSIELIMVRQNLSKTRLRHIDAVRNAQLAQAKLTPFMSGE